MTKYIKNILEILTVRYPCCHSREEKYGIQVIMQSKGWMESEQQRTVQNNLCSSSSKLLWKQQSRVSSTTARSGAIEIGTALWKINSRRGIRSSCRSPNSFWPTALLFDVCGCGFFLLLARIGAVFAAKSRTNAISTPLRIKSCAHKARMCANLYLWICALWDEMKMHSLHHGTIFLELLSPKLGSVASALADIL